MNTDPHMSERRTVERLLETLRDLPDVRAESPTYEVQYGKGDYREDAEIVLDVAGNQVVLLIEVKKSVYPRDAQQVLWQLSRYMIAERKQGMIVVPFLAAESISQGAKDLLKEESFGYFDTGGSLFIPARGAYFFIDKPPPKTYEKSIRGLFKGKRSQVLHALLIHNEEWFSVKELAERAEVSAGTASETLSALEKFEWVATKGQGPTKRRRLSDARALLDGWKAQTLSKSEGLAHRFYYVPGTKAEELTERLAHICESHGVRYVLTQEAAAQFYSPFLSSISRVTCRMPPGRAFEEAIDELGARAVGEGANLDVIETKSSSEFLFRERKKDVWLASPVQVYLDLLRAGGRAKEMSEHLRQERIGF